MILFAATLSPLLLPLPTPLSPLLLPLPAHSLGKQEVGVEDDNDDEEVGREENKEEDEEEEEDEGVRADVGAAERNVCERECAAARSTRMLRALQE